VETVLRTGFVYLFVLFVLRLMGKREFSDLSPVELIMLLLIPELFSQGIVREDFSMTNAVIAVSTLAGLVFVASALTYRFPRFGDLVHGRPAVLVARGEPVRETMDRERIPIDEIASQMRMAGIERLEDVKWAVVETSGRVSIVGYREGDVEPRTERTVR